MSLQKIRPFGNPMVFKIEYLSHGRFCEQKSESDLHNLLRYVNRINNQFILRYYFYAENSSKSE